MIADGPSRAGSFERRADEQRLLDRRRDDDRISAYINFLK